MIPLLKLVSFFYLISVISSQKTERKENQIYELVPDGKSDFVDCFGHKINTQIPAIYCYDGKKKELKSFWQTVWISVKLNDDLYEQFEGDSPESVMEKFKLHQSSWSVNVFAFRKRKSINLHPFNRTCIGILTKKDYSVQLIIKDIDSSLVLKFFAGLFLFFYARKLCHNQIFYYLCGVTFGILGSVLILTYLIGRICSSKTLGYGITASGWTLGIYFIQWLLDNVKLIALQYKEYVLGYIAFSGLLSFALCYRFGPMTNPRTRNLIQWSLQLAGLVLIFYSSQLREVTHTIVVGLICSRVIPFAFLFKTFGFVRRKLFRPKIKLLTRKEYVEQGREETKKALDELRGYCSSPECNPWKTVRKLKDPTRFAEFIEGSSHLSDEEVDQYGSLSIKANGTIITDDSDSIAEYSEEESL